MQTITSKTNDIIKLAVKLRDSAKERREKGLFLLEGARLCADAALCGVEIQTLLATGRALDTYAETLSGVTSSARQKNVISPELSAHISDTRSPQGIFCICKTLDKSVYTDTIQYNGRYVCLENVQTPGNLGACARTAEALGLDGLIVSGGCDIYNPKAMRASMGALLRLDVIFADDLPAFLRSARENGMTAYAAVPDPEDAVDVREMKKNAVIAVIGNEGSGLTEETVAACARKVTIPMNGRAESLNAAEAATIIMWETVS